MLGPFDIVQEKQPLNYFSGEALKDKEVLDRLLGRNKEEQERKIKERLEKRKQRLAEGILKEILNIILFQTFVEEHVNISEFAVKFSKN